MYLIEGNGYEAQHTSKDKTKNQHFMIMEGPQPWTIFCFVLRHHGQIT